jgi:hypothetical protein
MTAVASCPFAAAAMVPQPISSSRPRASSATHNRDTGLLVNSPDLNGDLAVDLADVALFAQDYFGPYNYRSDLCWDGRVGALNDLTYIAIALEANR